MQILDLPLFKLTVPTPFNVGPVNVYVITEPEVLMFDTGPKTPEARQAVEKGLSGLSLRLKDVKKIIITHGHPDHYGQAAELARESGAVIFAPKLDHPHFQHRTNEEFYLRMYREAGVSEKVIGVFAKEFGDIQSVAEPVGEYLPIGEGDEVPCGPLRLRVISTPGHTPGSLCFHAAEKRLLIAADTVIKRITPNPILNEDPTKPGTRYPSLKNYLASLDRLLQLQPRLVCSGHGDEVESFQPLYEKMLRHHDQRQLKILSLLDGKSKSLWSLAQELFPQVKEEGLFLALSEVYAHADLLEERSLIRSAWRDGVREIQAT